MTTFYPDIWEKIGEYLNSDDLFAISATCKSAYRAFGRNSIQKKISFPLLLPKRLTAEQRESVKAMEKLKSTVKLIHGDVGSGKTIVALSYALRNDFDKLFIVVPPALIKMWWKTCQEYFGIEPVVLHGTNPKYSKSTDKTKDEIPDSKVILTSYKIFDKTNFSWMKYTKNLLIIDETHHKVGIYGKKFEEVIGLSATLFKYHHLSWGVRDLLQDSGKDIHNVLFNLDKKIIASKLPPVKHLDPHCWKIPQELTMYILTNASPLLGDGGRNLRDVFWISQTLSHPFIENYKSYYTGEDYIKVGKKKFRIPHNYNRLFEPERIKFEEENGPIANILNENPVNQEKLKNYRKKLEKAKEEFADIEMKRMFRTCVKYYQCLSILEYLEKREEKAIILDTSTSYLPFLYKFLFDKGINTYIFSTHYDVTGRQRQLEKFKKDEKSAVLISSTSMLGEGHNITEANHVIFLTAMLDKNKYHQGIGRCWRYPQSKTVYVHHLFNSKLDRKIYEHSQGLTDLRQLDWLNCLSN